MISVTHLSKKHGSFTAVDDLSFDVREGKVLGFRGPNGAGKTTTMRMLTGFLPPSHGRVRAGGFDLYNHPVQAKQRLEYLPENPISLVNHEHPVTRGFEQRTIFGRAVPVAVTRTDIGMPRPFVSTSNTTFERVDLVSRATEFRAGRVDRGRS